MRRRRPGKIPAANNKCVGAAAAATAAATLHATDTQLMRTQCSPLCVCVCLLRTTFAYVLLACSHSPPP